MDLDTIKLKIRKNKDIIYTNGYGILVFVLWSLVKLILYLVDIAPYVSPGVEDELDVVYSSLTLASSLIECAIAIATGVVAINAGKKDKPYRSSLIALAVITCFLSIDFIIFDFWVAMFLVETFSSTALIGVITDVFFFSVVLVLLVAAIKLYKLEKKAKGLNYHEC